MTSSEHLLPDHYYPSAPAAPLRGFDPVPAAGEAGEGPPAAAGATKRSAATELSHGLLRVGHGGSGTMIVDRRPS